MSDRFSDTLEDLSRSSNLRSIPQDCGDGIIDLSTNDYLGIARRTDLAELFYSTADPSELMLTSSASRLLADRQREYIRLESLLETLYPSRRVLLFNSGYHANTGIVQALAGSRTLILADKFVHASIIDGMTLSKAPFFRFRHNDLSHLERLLEKHTPDYDDVLVIVESVYSMDGDSCDIDRLIDIKHRYPRVMLYVDEAHAFGVCGPAGLGLVAGSREPDAVDVVVGTFGKAAASSGAFCATRPHIREFLVNKARSFIFSTAIAPVSVAWSRFVIGRMIGMDSERQRLRQLSHLLAGAIGRLSGGNPVVSHIQPLIVGDSARTVVLSGRLLEMGVKVLPIRTPTVPPSTERLRFSLSAAMTDGDMEKVIHSLDLLDETANL